MTYHIAVTSRDYVQLASDRLVTIEPQHPTAAFRPYDRAANKTVLLAGRDGILALGYTGVAYLGPLGTDQFIAQALLGAPIPPGLPGAIIGSPTAPIPRVGDAFHRMRLALDTALAAQPGGARTAPFGVIACGWRIGLGRHRHAYARFMWRLWRSSGEPLRWDRPKFGGPIIGSVPPTLLPKRSADSLFAEMERSPADFKATGAMLVEEIRRAADESAASGREVIGRDVEVVTLASPTSGSNAIATFHADATEGVHISYSPWAISNGNPIPPFTMEAHGAVDPTEPMTPGLVFGFGRGWLYLPSGGAGTMTIRTQQRTPPPSR